MWLVGDKLTAKITNLITPNLVNFLNIKQPNHRRFFSLLT